MKFNNSSSFCAFQKQLSSMTFWTKWLVSQNYIVCLENQLDLEFNLRLVFWFLSCVQNELKVNCRSRHWNVSNKTARDCEILFKLTSVF